MCYTFAFVSSVYWSLSFCPYLQLLLFVQQALSLWRRAKSVFNKALQSLNLHEWLVQHHSAVAAQHHDGYRLVTGFWSRRLDTFSGRTRGEFWKQILKCFPSIEGSAGQGCSPLQDTENTYGTAERVLLGTEKKETRITHCYITRLAPPFQSGSVSLVG